MAFHHHNFIPYSLQEPIWKYLGHQGTKQIIPFIALCSQSNTFALNSFILKRIFFFILACEVNYFKILKVYIVA